MAFTADDIRVIDNLVPDALEEALKLLGQAPIWRHGHRSAETEGTFAHWSRHFAGGDCDHRDSCEDELREIGPAPVVELWDHLNATLLNGQEPLRVYANAHTFGVEGYCHQDNIDGGDYYSTIYFPIETWNRNWGGETLFFDDNHDILKAVAPKPGRLIHFPGAVYHRASGVSRACDHLRVCFVIKTQWKA